MNINSLKRCAVLGAILVGVGFSLPVAAQSHGGGGGHSGGGAHAGGPHGGGGGWHGGSGGWHGGGWRGGGPGWWGVGLGLGWDALYFGYPYYGYPYPGYYYPYGSSTVIVGPTDPLAQTPQNPPPVANWYYCESAKAYYPYVRQCPEGWHLVPAAPTGSVR